MDLRVIAPILVMLTAVSIGFTDSFGGARSSYNLISEREYFPASWESDYFKADMSGFYSAPHTIRIFGDEPVTGHASITLGVKKFCYKSKRDESLKKSFFKLDKVIDNNPASPCKGRGLERSPASDLSQELSVLLQKGDEVNFIIEGGDCYTGKAACKKTSASAIIKFDKNKSLNF